MRFLKITPAAEEEDRRGCGESNKKALQSPDRNNAGQDCCAGSGYGEKWEDLKH